MSRSKPLTVCFVIPFHNEADCARATIERMREMLATSHANAEIILVDDGSRDNTLTLLLDRAEEDEHITVLELLTNYGQVAALSAGMTYATGDMIVTLDGDLQNDPADIPKLLAEIYNGHDLAGGIRSNRRDTWARRHIGRMACAITRMLTGAAIRDIGCSLKAYHRDVIEMLRGSDGIVQFNTVTAFKMARSAVEIPVRHHPRRHGRSKWKLLAKVQFMVELLSAAAALPLFLIMLAGFGATACGIGLYLLYLLGITSGVLAMSSPASIVLHGFTIGLMGFAGHLVVRTLEVSKGRPLFRVKRVWPEDRPLPDGLPKAAYPIYLSETQREHLQRCPETLVS